MFPKNFIYFLISLLLLSSTGLSKPSHRNNSLDHDVPPTPPPAADTIHLLDDPELVQGGLKVDLAYENSKKLSGRRDNIDERGPYFEGDMVIQHDLKKDFMMTKSGILGNQYRWPGGQVPYAIDTTFTSAEVNIIMQALNEISSKTCIKFVPRANNYVVNYIYLRRGAAGSGCYSDVGMKQNTFNNINLQPGNPGCVFMGIVAHEIIHAIGYYHEQSRTDRDSYVTINWSNIQSGQSHNFVKYDATQVSPFNVGYDFNSIMHYSAYAFAINTATPTIYPPSNVSPSTLGQRNGLSAADAQKINNMYAGICP